MQFPSERVGVEALSPMRVSKVIPSINGGTPIVSWRWPGKQDETSQIAEPVDEGHDLGVRPPRERPIA